MPIAAFSQGRNARDKGTFSACATYVELVAKTAVLC